MNCIDEATENFYKFKLSECGITDRELNKALTTIDTLPSDSVNKGELSKEEYRLVVKRLLSDMAPPTASKSGYYSPKLDHPDAKNCVDLIYKIISSTLLKNTLKNNLSLRRIQFNSMSIGNFIGVHDDYSANKEYKYTLVVGASKSYSGGFLKIKPSKGKIFSVQPKFGDVILFTSKFKHEITKITSGERNTIVAFLSFKKSTIDIEF